MENHLIKRKSNKAPSMNDANNTHSLFFKSLLRDLNRLNDEQVREFRKYIIDCIDKILNEDNYNNNKIKEDVNHQNKNKFLEVKQKDNIIKIQQDVKDDNVEDDDEGQEDSLKNGEFSSIYSSTSSSLCTIITNSMSTLCSLNTVIEIEQIDSNERQCESWTGYPTEGASKAAFSSL